jgi:putative ubiquitin-RnfH superfamily antitoxin RatB of RatAB toxin-antitoxin module
MARAEVDPGETPPQLSVKVAYGPKAGAAQELSLRVAAGSTVLDVLQLSGLLERYPEIDLATQSVGVWGHLRTLDAALRDGDRVEVYRPLQVDPKEARRLRQREQREATCSRKQ